MYPDRWACLVSLTTLKLYSAGTFPARPPGNMHTPFIKAITSSYIRGSYELSQRGVGKVADSMCTSVYRLPCVPTRLLANKAVFPNNPHRWSAVERSAHMIATDDACRCQLNCEGTPRIADGRHTSASQCGVSFCGKVYISGIHSVLQPSATQSSSYTAATSVGNRL